MNLDSNLIFSKLKQLEGMVKDDPELIKQCGKLTEDIKLSKFTILELIENLGYLLISTSYSERALGMSILSQVIGNLPSDFLSVEPLTVISAYFSDKLKDHHEVAVTALKGVVPIIKFKSIITESVVKLVSSLFLNITCQQQQQPDRYTVYEIFKIIVDKHPFVIDSMGMDFVYGVVSAIDGERDPKNLLFLFSWIKSFLQSVPLGHLTEEMFEVLACYFPVDFKAPSQDPNNITRQTLADALCPCLCAIPEFSQYCIPLSLEKLDSSLKIAKMDSLHLLKKGCETFNASSYEQYSSEIWAQIQKEIINSSDPEIESSCLETLSAVIKKLSEADGPFFQTSLENILDTLKGNMFPDSKLYKSSSSMLIYTASACEKSSEFIVKNIVPLLENTFSITNTGRHKAEILRSLISFLKTFIQHHENISITEVEELAVIPLLCFKASLEPDDELKAIGFAGFSEIAGFLPNDIRTTLLDNLHLAVIRKEADIVRNAILKCLTIIAELYSEEVKSKIFFQQKITDETSLNLYLEALSSLITIKDFTECVANILLTYAFDEIALGSVSLRNIRLVLETSLDSQILQMFLDKGIIEKLVLYAVSQSLNIIERTDLLTDITCVLKILVGSQNSSLQEQIIRMQLPIVERCKDQERVYVSLLSGLFTRVRQETSIDFGIVDMLVDICIGCDDDFVKDLAVQLLANCVNKADNGLLENKLQTIKQNCQEHLNKNNQNVVIVMCWITKALIMRNHAQANVWIDLLLDLLDKHSQVAKGFEIIMDDSYDALSLCSYCNKTSLYRQKFFILVTNKLSDLYTPEKSSHLDAVGYLIKNAPQQALILQFRKIAKLVMLCLEKCTNPEILHILLDALGVFITNKESLIEENLEDFLTRILRLTSFDSSMKVRLVALQCLKKIASTFAVYKLLPLKQEVIQQLGICIDDKKRLVRKEAMEARSLWFLIDMPT